jgi:hypothetical protein
MAREWNWQEEDNFEHVIRAARHSFAHEVHCYGIADGVDRLPPDPSYSSYPEYMRGHRVGLGMQASKEAVASGRGD